MAMLAFTAHDELQLFLLLVALGVTLVAAAVGRLPPSILLVGGGLALGFVPGLPHLTLPPDLVLVAILPPLLCSAAFFTGLRDLRANLRPISLLADGRARRHGGRAPRRSTAQGRLHHRRREPRQRRDRTRARQDRRGGRGGR